MGPLSLDLIGIAVWSGHGRLDVVFFLLSATDEIHTSEAMRTFLECVKVSLNAIALVVGVPNKGRSGEIGRHGAIASK